MIVAAEAEVLPPAQRLPAAVPRLDWAERIRESYRRGVEGIIETGRLLIEAKAALPHGEFEAMVERDLPFDPSVARKLRLIASHPILANRAHVHALPASWGTLYELSKLDEKCVEAKLNDGTIRPSIERHEVIALRREKETAGARAAYQDRKSKGCTIEDLDELAASGFQAGSIEADPNWKFRSWSDKGNGRSPDQHYNTDDLAPIKALPVTRLAAPNCALYLWCMDWLLPAALEVIEAWGFKYVKVAFVWVKKNPSGKGLAMGLGKWTREGAELCLFATKGKPKRLNADVRQVIIARRAEHSRKPAETHRRIERLTTGPYLELYARRERKGWLSWGDEIPRHRFKADTPNARKIIAPKRLRKTKPRKRSGKGKVRPHT